MYNNIMYLDCSINTSTYTIFDPHFPRIVLKFNHKHAHSSPSPYISQKQGSLLLPPSPSSSHSFSPALLLRIPSSAFSLSLLRSLSLPTRSPVHSYTIQTIHTQITDHRDLQSPTMHLTKLLNDKTRQTKKLPLT